MKKLKRTFLSLAAIAVLLLMNPGVLAIQVYAWDNWTSQPQWNNPAWSQPGWTTPPDWKDPAWTTPPEWQDPSGATPPEWNDSNWKNAPEWKSGQQWNNSPWQTKPEWNKNPNTNPANGPDVNPNNPSTSPDGTNNQNPDGKLPGPPYNPDYKNPGIEKMEQIDQTIKQPSAKDEKTASEDEPFFNFENMKQKDAISFAVKDVIGGTADLAVQVVTENKELTLKDLLNNRKSIYLSGFKSLTKGDTTVDFLYNSADAVTGAKGVYDSFNTFKGYKAYQDLMKTGNVIAAAQKYDELLQAGKTFTPANAVVSAIAMPFTIMDTVENVGKFNAAKNTGKKVSVGMDLVGNAGGIISGAAAGVALIPGAQPIAAGMLVVGGALSLASLGYKIYSNREKVVKDVKKKFKKAKEKVTGFFKSVFGG
jgi:hypothetical protein